jgi:hypothetical protein
MGGFSVAENDLFVWRLAGFQKLGFDPSSSTLENQPTFGNQ